MNKPTFTAAIIYTFAMFFATGLMADPTAKDAAKEKEPEKKVFWSTNLADGHRRSFADGKPMFVIVGAKWCPSCRKMARELEKSPAADELARWTAVSLDHDLDASEVEQLGVLSVPALRIFSPTGQQVAEHNEYLSPKDFVAWLKKQYPTATSEADSALLGGGRPSVLTVVKLVKQFDERNPALREAAVRRLIPYPNEAKASVVKAFTEGGLSARLAARELLDEWKAPIEGLDPWRPDTFKPERLTELEKWKEQEIKTDELAKELAGEQLADARAQIDRMLGGGEVEARAVRHRLARYGTALMPEVYARLKEAVTDQDRRRLLALRYRLAADDALVLSWPGGLDRLADRDARKRRLAAEELAARATSTEQPLLLELFADPDALVREISLRGLRNIGGKKANAVLVKLLDDPDLNVRAAVLKQLEAAPTPEMTAAIIKYLEKETDADLVCHGIRVLQSSRGTEVVQCLMTLLKHDSWQVRAEAVTAMGKAVSLSSSYSSYSSSGMMMGESTDKTQLAAQVYTALLGLLDDPEPFVVAKAVEGLSGADLAVAVEPLIKAAEKYPDLAPSILEMLSRGTAMRMKSLAYVKKFTEHKNPRIRAAALQALSQYSFDDLERYILAGLADQDSSVRIAAATATLEAFDKIGEQAKQQRKQAERAVRSMQTDSPRVDTNVFSAAAKLLGGMLGGKETAKPADAEADMDVKKAEGKNSDKKTELAEKTEEKKEQKEEEYWWDPWLRDFHAGKHRSKWTEKIVPLAEKMLTGETPKERIVAVVLLSSLGKADDALPVLYKTVKEDPDSVKDTVKVLTWLEWNKRKEAFHKLHPLVAGSTSFVYLISGLGEVEDPRAAELYWLLLNDPKIDQEQASLLRWGLMVIYTGSRYHSSDLDTGQRIKIVEEVKPRIHEGSVWQRLTALVILANMDKNEAAALAPKIAADDKLDDQLRDAAYRIQLATQSDLDARTAAISELGSERTNAKRKKVALIYLAHGAGELRYMDGEFDLSFSVTYYGSSYENKPIIPKPPAGLKLEHVRSLIKDSDPETAALAGYLAALLGEKEGLEPLLKYWREKKQNDSDWEKSVYRAIAVIDDPANIPVLREIFEELREYELREFYWTIRIMSGEEILKLRKEVREKMKGNNSMEVLFH